MTQIHYSKSKVFNRIPDMVGKIYGYLTVLGLSHITEKMVYDKRTQHKHPNKFYHLKCKCVCGKETIVEFQTLGRNTRSCGCDNGGRTRRKYTSNPVEGNARDIYKFYRTNNPGDLSFEQFLELSSLSCNYCGSSPSNISRGTHKQGYRYDAPFIYSGLDRVDSQKPHDYNNCVPCCYTCNLAKSNKSEEDFLNWIDRAYTYQHKKVLK